MPCCFAPARREASSYGETTFEEVKRLWLPLGERYSLARERTKLTERTMRKIRPIGDITIRVTIQRIRKRMPLFFGSKLRDVFIQPETRSQTLF